MPHHAPIQIRVDSDPKHLCVVRSAVETAAEIFGLAEGDGNKLVLAVDEAMTNIIRHGYHGKSDQPIWVTLSPVKQNGHVGIEVVIDDETEHVDPSAIKPKPMDPTRPGGLGVAIIQQSVDQCAYQCRSDGKGIRLTLRKFASPSEPSSAPTP